MIKSETDTVQPADERYTDRRQMRTDTVRAGHDEHTQKGARKAQKAVRRHLKGKG